MTKPTEPNSPPPHPRFLPGDCCLHWTVCGLILNTLADVGRLTPKVAHSLGKGSWTVYEQRTRVEHKQATVHPVLSTLACRFLRLAGSGCLDFSAAMYCGFSWRTSSSPPSNFLSRTQGFIWFPSIPRPFALPRFLVLARRYFNYLPLARHQRHTANSVLNSAASSGSCPGGRCCLGVLRLSAQEGARSPESLLTSLRCGI